MNITEASKYFEVRAESAKWKHQKKFYTKFSKVLSDLLTKNLDADKLGQIEREIAKMKLDPLKPQRNYQYSRKYNYFTKYLLDKLDLVPVRYYQETYLALGMVFGLVAGGVVSYSLSFGSNFNSEFILGMPFGMIGGMLLGRRKDKAAEESGQVLGAG
jgi:hypothetical protein